MRIRNPFLCSVVTGLVVCLLCVLVAAQSAPSSSKPASAPNMAETASGYNQPPKYILDVMRASSPPQPIVSPTHDAILLVSWQEYPSIARVATPFLRLAGVRVEPKNHSRHDTRGGYGITPCATGFELVRVADGKQTPRPASHGMCPGNPVWAADGKLFRLRQHCFRFRPALDWRRQYRRGETGSRCPSQPHVQRRNAMDARSENASRQACAEVHRRATARGQCALRSEHPGNQRAKRPEQHLRSSRHPQQCARRELFSITSRSRNSLSSIPPPSPSRPSVSPPITNHSIPPRTDTTSS